MKKDILLLGAPGAGKGTQAKFLEESLNLVKIDTGNLIRANIKEQTELGKKAKEYVEQGILIPDELIIDLIVSKAREIKAQNKNFLLDGFPRNLNQARALDNNNLGVDVVIEIDVDKESLIERICGRRICSNKECGAVYHIKFRPSQKKETCDLCGSALYQRDDDKEDLVKSRLDTYEKETLPLSEFYEKAGKLIKVDGNRELTEVSESIIERL